MLLKNLKLIILLTLIFNNYLFAQPDIEWGKNYGGTENEIFFWIHQTIDGGYITAGGTSSNSIDVNMNNGYQDVWVVKVDMLGDIEWEKSYGGSQFDLAISMHPTLDGGYIISGKSSSDDGDVGGNLGSDDFWIIKIDMSGNIEWEKNYGGSYYEYACVAKQTTDGGYIVAGDTKSDDGNVGENYGEEDAWILKLDELGNIEWSKIYGGSDVDKVYDLVLVEDGGYVVASMSKSDDGDVGVNNGGEEFWIFKIDSLGNLEWEKNYGGSDDEQVQSIVKIKDNGGYIAVGITYSSDGDISSMNGGSDFWVVKMDLEGNLVWEKNYGGSGYERATSIQQTNDDGFIIAGSTNSNDGDISVNAGLTDFWIIKIDEVGNMEWEKTYGGASDEAPFSIQQTTDDGYVIAGRSRSDNGDVPDNYGGTDCWILKLAPVPVGISTTEYAPEISISPNPTQGLFTIQIDSFSDPVSISITNNLGILVYSKNDVQSELQIDELPKGNYFINIASEKINLTKKIIVQ
ncbi:MAG: T9SS type A sorting domain-containing protein [Saprospiraceae bacterium]